jgi:hypothetical protein
VIVSFGAAARWGPIRCGNDGDVCAEAGVFKNAANVSRSAHLTVTTAARMIRVWNYSS